VENGFDPVGALLKTNFQNSTKIDLLFACLNLDLIFQKKAPEKCAFHGLGFKSKGTKYVNIETWLLFGPPPIKISGYAPGSQSHEFEARTIV